MNIQIRKTALAVLMLSLAAISLPACSGNSGNNTTKENVAKTPATSGLVLKNEAEQNVPISALKGKVVFMNFWATWCPPCKRELPTIDKLKKSFAGKDIVFVMVDVDGKMKESAQFMKDHGYDLPVYIANGEIPSKFVSDAIPVTVILNRNGKMVKRIVGAYDYTSPEITNLLKKLLAKK